MYIKSWLDTPLNPLNLLEFFLINGIGADG
jgi:hypothetical protein